MEPDDTVYLMAVPFQEPTGTVAPSAGLSTEVPRDGSLVSQAVVYPMLSQRMGVHCGTNVLLPGDGDHEVTVRVGGTAVRRYGALAGPAGDSATATVPFAYRAAERDDIDDEQFDRTGARDAGVDGDETRFRPAPDPRARRPLRRSPRPPADARLTVDVPAQVARHEGVRDGAPRDGRPRYRVTDASP